MRAVLAPVLWGILTKGAWADCGDVTLQDLAKEAVAAVVDDELERAEAWVDEGLRGARCTPSPVDPHAYATLWQVRAAVHFFRGDDALDAAIGQAVAVSMDWFEPRLGSSLQTQWEAPHHRIAQHSTVRIEPMTPRASLWVNGQGQPGDSAQVLPGLHLVQVVDDGSVVFHRMVDLQGGEQAILDAGLQQSRSAPPLVPTSLLGRCALGGGALAVASWGGAMALDRSSLQATTLEAHDAQYAASRALAGAALGTAAVSLALWGVDRWRR